MDLGVSLKVLLAKNKMSQIELAERLGVQRQIVTRWAATGSIPRERIEQLSDMFGIKPSEFVALGE